ncbi:MAG: hypothetical protein KatS3mg113_0801 [Planctomycetaceae bacterium]|nr:MAG: hypothetical protein KatS3mg113_0801 [Planctomycetaceae bacterium]
MACTYRAQQGSSVERFITLCRSRGVHRGENPLHQVIVCSDHVIFARGFLQFNIQTQAADLIT